MSRILTETRVGKWQFDVTSMNAGMMDILVRRSLISTYVSPETGAYIQEFEDGDGHWTGIFNNYYVIGYNSRLVSEPEAPKHWENLLDPGGKGGSPSIGKNTSGMRRCLRRVAGRKLKVYEGTGQTANTIAQRSHTHGPVDFCRRVPCGPGLRPSHRGDEEERSTGSMNRYV